MDESDDVKTLALLTCDDLPGLSEHLVNNDIECALSIIEGDVLIQSGRAFGKCPINLEIDVHFYTEGCHPTLVEFCAIP